MTAVCAPEKCTMCGACRAACTQGCITPIEKDRQWYMAIENDKCVGCNICKKACPTLNKPIMTAAEKVFVAWSTNDMQRRLSASGGVAAALYEYAISKGMYVAGVYLDENFEAHYSVTNNASELPRFQNSKYTYSYMDSVHEQVRNLLVSGNDVLFIGLPCQVAAIKNYTELKKHAGKLLTVDIICHGTPPPTYLKQHVKAVEEKKNKKAKELFFRDASYKTDNFAFSMYGESREGPDSFPEIYKAGVMRNHKPFYVKKVQSNDMYQIGYHNGWIYRECCYKCDYAQKSRCGDLTVGDAHGLGKVQQYDGVKENNSFVFVNTRRGAEMLSMLLENKVIQARERPLEEPYKYEPQLSHPSNGANSSERAVFLTEIKRTGNYEQAANIAFKSKARKNRIRQILCIDMIKKCLKRVIPRSIISRLK